MFDARKFWSKVDSSGGPDACWEWQGYRLPLGYGQYTQNRIHYRANRVAALLGGISLRSEDLACHSCDNPPCCNPSHLFAGSPHDNVLDMIDKGRCRAGIRQAERTHCPQGHSYDEVNTYISGGRRMCRVCRQERSRAWKSRQRTGGKS